MKLLALVLTFPLVFLAGLVAGKGSTPPRIVEVPVVETRVVAAPMLPPSAARVACTNGSAALDRAYREHLLRENLTARTSHEAR